MSNLENSKNGPENPVDPKVVERARKKINDSSIHIDGSHKAGAIANLSKKINKEEDFGHESSIWLSYNPEVHNGVVLKYNPLVINKMSGSEVIAKLLQKYLELMFRDPKLSDKLKSWCDKSKRIYSSELLGVAIKMAINEILIDWSSKDPYKPKSKVQEAAIANCKILPDSNFYRKEPHTQRKTDEEGNYIKNEFEEFPALKSSTTYFKELCEHTGNTEGSAELPPKDKEEIDQKILDLSEFLDPDDQEVSPVQEGQGMHDSQERSLRGGIIDAIESSTSKEGGTGIGSGSMGKAIRKKFPVKDGRYNWKQLLKSSLTSGKFNDVRTSSNKYNSRFIGIPKAKLPVLPMARERVRDHKVVVIADTSGSMMGHLHKVYEVVLSLKNTKPKLRFFVIEWDCKLQREFEIKTKNDILEQSQNSQGLGGTTFGPAIEYAVETHKPDTLVYVTDGYGDPGQQSVVRGINFIWMVSSHGRKPASWGKEVALNYDLPPQS